MLKYLKNPFPKVTNPFDSHTHMFSWKKEGSDKFYIHGLEKYRKACGLKYITIAASPSGNPILRIFPRDVSNNIMCAFYKLANKNTFAYGGFIYPSYPANENEMKDMDPLTQLDELSEIGFDGIKMLEGKPSVYTLIGKPLDSSFFDSAINKMEQEGINLLMHVADPEFCWTNPTEELIKNGWSYSDETKYPSYKEFYRQVLSILEKHPKLNICLAHFFFSSETPEKLEELFAKYPNLCIDITPGGEMYFEFNKRPEYYRNFFIKYADRIIFGTDMTDTHFAPLAKNGNWFCDRIYRFLATDETITSFNNNALTGIKLPDSVLQKIFSDNITSKLGDKPKPINKEALRRYIAKYRHLIIDEKLSCYIDELSDKYLK